MINLYKLLLISCICFTFLYSKTIYVYNGQPTSNNLKSQYGIEALKLALNKTISKHGKYELHFGKKMNIKRAIITIKSNKIKNFISKISVTKDLLKDLSYANFPVDRGIVGYRVSFMSSKLKDNSVKYDSLKKIKKLTFAQGVGWLDTYILKYNGFHVKEISNREGLVNMVALGRADFFPRGIAEIFEEKRLFKNIKNLTYDESFMLNYPLPRFFFSHKSNKKAMKRVEEGLLLAYEDGSLEKVFSKFYKKDIDLLKLNNRKIYKLINPYLEGIDTSYEKYNYNPLEKN